MPTKANSNAGTKASNDDAFDSSKYIKADTYEAAIKAINERLDAIETRMKDKTAVVATLKEVFESDHNIDPVMTTYFASGRIDLKPAVKESVKEVDREWWNKSWKKILTAVAAVVLALISGLAGYVLRGGN